MLGSRSAGALISAVAVFAAVGAAAWVGPTDITNWPDYECGPRAVRDSANNLHLVWFGGAPDSSGWKIYYQKYNGSSWTTPVAISGSAASEPSIAIDGGNNLHAVWHAGGNPEEIYYRKCTGGAWGSTVNLSNSSGVRSLHPRVAVDSTGNDIVVVWHESGMTGGNWDIVARKYAAGAWGGLENVSNDSTLSRTADIALDAAGNYHVAWEDTDTKNLYYSKRSAGGWSSKIALDTTSGRSYGASVAVSPNGNVHVVWHDDNNDDWDIAYRRWNGSSWGSVVNISNNPGVIDCGACVATDSENQVYVVWHDYDNIYYAHTRSGVWRTDYIISYGTYQTGPCVVLDGNKRCHVLWQCRMPGSWDVWWSWQDPDNTPPAAASRFSASGSDSKVYLNWRNPSDLDFQGTMVRFKTTGYPTGPTDGALVCDRRASRGSDDSFIHTGLNNGVTYYYSAFTYDAEPNYSAAVQTSARASGMTCAYVKQLAENSPVDMYSKVVSAVFGTDGCIYIEEPDRTSGLRVVTSQTGLAVGDRVNVAGTVTTRKPDGVNPSERQVSNATVTRTTSGAPLEPYAMPSRAVGGAAIPPHVPGVKDGVGLNNIGLLIRMAGTVTYKVSSYIYVDDGSHIQDISGRIGVMVKCPSTSIPVNVGDVVVVTGVVQGSIPTGWTQNRRYMQMRDWNDLVSVPSN